MKSLRILSFGLLLAVAAGAQTFEVAEASIAAQQKAMTEGRVTSKALVQSYLGRIEAFDQHGPRLNTLIVINPNALKEAEALDRERAAKGPRGPLHGIPVIVKDNYSTTDMPTTAGSMALMGFVPSHDAFQVRKLREAGAVIIGKSNLHELASGITTISSAGGQTLNPYDHTRNPGGSSGGTGAAIAASLAAAGMGSDTCGSIRIPSAHNNLVRLRPTKGLSSIAGIVPLSTTQDVGGPLARTVEDLAVMLDATIGEDPADAATHLQAGQTRPRFADALKPGGLQGAHIGILEALFGDKGDDQDVIRVVRAAIDEMKKQGAEVVSVPMPELDAALEGSAVIEFEFQQDLKDYLAQNGPAPVASLAEIVEKGLFHSALETGFRRRLASPGRDSEEYKKAMAKRTAIATAILKVMNDQKLDALVYPTMKRRPAKVGEPQGGSNCQLSPSTGFPAIAMQAGFTTDGLPVAVELFGRPFDDAKLVSLAYDYERTNQHRRAPALTPALGTRTSLPVISWQSTVGRISAAFSFDPATNELKYNLTAKGFAKDDILAATLHRAEKSDAGPAIAVLSNRPFEKLDGSETLSSIDREKLLSGGLYLRVATRLKDTASIRMPLTPDSAPRPPQPE
jgi:Asp-tRNA(Asn)/Glu-tRNA(Gln) amidotransferase A subunit family amidase